jgi:tRNA threonylcarbamoyladenosine biosynthesis protein TsaE
MDIGLDELLLDDGVAIVEWAERIEPLLPPDHLRITLAVLDETRRQLTFEPHGSRAAELLARINGQW